MAQTVAVAMKSDKQEVDSINGCEGRDAEIEMWEDVAHEADEFEHKLTFREALAVYPMAVVWTGIFCLCIIMDAYDTILMTNFYGLNAFQRRFGVPYKDGYIVPAKWQTAFAMCTPVGRIIGGAIQGPLAERVGRKRALMICLTVLSGFIFITFFSTTNGVLLTGLMLCGVPWGIMTSLAPTYASEICPLQLRDILTAYVQLCWSTGQLLGVGVLAGMTHFQSNWGYRIPLGLQWIWPVIIFPLVCFAPESPYWLVRHGKLEQAENVLRRLIRKSSKVDVKAMLAMVQRTNLHEEQQGTAVNYWDCFKGSNLRRTEISAMAWSIQVLCGLSLPLYIVVFLREAGMTADDAYYVNVGMKGIGFVGTCLSFILVRFFGRRTLFLGGLSIMTLLMLLVGFLGIAPKSPTMLHAEVGLLFIWFLLYFLTTGPVAYVIFSEISATRLRGHTIAISLIFYSIFSIIYNVSSPYLLSPQEANMGAKTGLVYGSISLLACIWCYFRLPESKGRTFEELDIMFERKVPTKRFKTYVVDSAEDN